jgi:hypothetical protein
MMKKEKDFTTDIQQVKDDLQQLETDMLVLNTKLYEMQKHKETLIYFLDVIDFE